MTLQTYYLESLHEDVLVKAVKFVELAGSSQVTGSAFAPMFNLWLVVYMTWFES